MAPRANWKGYLRLSLVSCPIALYPASSLSEKVSFNRINRKTGNRLKQHQVKALSCSLHSSGRWMRNIVAILVCALAIPSSTLLLRALA
jgi:hypothetical protein